MGQAKQEHVAPTAEGHNGVTNGERKKGGRAAWPFDTTDTHNNPTAPNLTTEIPPPHLIFYRTVKVGLAWQGGRWQGGGVGTGKTSPPRVKKTTLCHHHHLRLPPRAPSPLHRCHAPRKRTLIFISSSLARARAAMAERGASGAGGGAAPHHFQQVVSESAAPPTCPSLLCPSLCGPTLRVRLCQRWIPSKLCLAEPILRVSGFPYTGPYWAR